MRQAEARVMKLEHTLKSKPHDLVSFLCKMIKMKPKLYALVSDWVGAEWCVIKTRSQDFEKEGYTFELCQTSGR